MIRASSSSNMRQAWLPLVAGVLLAPILACRATEPSSPELCTAEFRYGLQVRVQDSASGEWAASGARLVTFTALGVVDPGASSPAMLPPNRPDLDSLPLLGAGERGGTYRVVVQKPGYEDWVKTGVVVAEGRCHVVTTTLTARLQRR